jgi:GT2 family glycosyltransferase
MRFSQKDKMKVAVVLLNWNGGGLTIPCIKSLLASDYLPWRIVVFDNASTDGSPDEISKRLPDVHLMKSPTNLGFTGGNNAAIRHLLKEDADLIWILNNDTVVDKKCLGTMVKAMQEDPEIAGISGKILFETPPDLINYAGAHWNYWTFSARLRGLKEFDRGQYDQACDIGCLSGCSMLIRKEAFEAIGLLNERYFAYSEDVEWSLRATRAGLRLRYVPQAVLWHKLHASIIKNTGGVKPGKASPRNEYLQVRNSLFMARQYADRPWQFITALTVYLTNRIYRSLGLLVLGRWKSSFAIWRGIYDGWLDCYFVSPENLEKK